MKHKKLQKLTQELTPVLMPKLTSKPMPKLILGHRGMQENQLVSCIRSFDQFIDGFFTALNSISGIYLPASRLHASASTSSFPHKAKAMSVPPF